MLVQEYERKGGQKGHTSGSADISLPLAELGRVTGRDGIDALDHLNLNVLVFSDVFFRYNYGRLAEIIGDRSGYHGRQDRRYEDARGHHDPGEVGEKHGV